MNPIVGDGALDHAAPAAERHREPGPHDLLDRLGVDTGQLRVLGRGPALVGQVVGRPLRVQVQRVVVLVVVPMVLGRAAGRRVSGRDSPAGHSPVPAGRSS